MAPFHLDRPEAFTSDECAAIVALACASAMEPATVWGAAGDDIVPERRRAERCHLVRDDTTGWIFERLDALFAEAAEQFGIPVDPVFEAIQVVRYGPGDHFQSWHTDAGTDRHDERRLSLSVELSDPADHDGGVLEIAPGTLGAARPAARRSAAVSIARDPSGNAGDSWRALGAGRVDGPAALAAMRPDRRSPGVPST